LLAALKPHFFGDMCGEKIHIERKHALKAGFQERWGGIGGDRVQSENL
jgi:hypothetical protein